MNRGPRYDFCRRLWLAGDRSIDSATITPTMGQNVHWPPNQWWTAVYQSSVVGRKKKPRTGQSPVLKMP